jgi:hypothetical protein
VASRTWKPPSIVALRITSPLAAVNMARFSAHGPARRCLIQPTQIVPCDRHVTRPIWHVLGLQCLHRPQVK